MNTGVKRALFWTPRILCILFTAFISIFAFDAFGQGLGFWDTVIAFVMELVPVYVLIIVLVVSWKWEWIGAVLFTALAVFYVVWAWGRFYWSVYAEISGPLVLLGVLFLFNWIYRAQLRTG